MKFIYSLIALLLVIVLFVIYKRVTNIADYIKPSENLTVTSKSFKNEGKIPLKHTGYGSDISPEITIHEIDPNAQTIAIIMDDLDHPIGVYNHWLIWNIPAYMNVIPEGIAKETTLKEIGNAIQGKSAYGGKHYYRGPKPPFGSHKYAFKIYVLDTELNIDSNSTKKDLQLAMDGHVLQYGVLLGEYK